MLGGLPGSKSRQSDQKLADRAECRLEIAFMLQAVVGAGQQQLLSGACGAHLGKKFGIVMRVSFALDEKERGLTCSSAARRTGFLNRGVSQTKAYWLGPAGRLRDNWPSASVPKDLPTRTTSSYCPEFRPALSAAEASAASQRKRSSLLSLARLVCLWVKPYSMVSTSAPREKSQRAG